MLFKAIGIEMPEGRPAGRLICRSSWHPRVDAFGSFSLNLNSISLAMMPDAPEGSSTDTMEDIDGEPMDEAECEEEERPTDDEPVLEEELKDVEKSEAWRASE